MGPLTAYAKSEALTWLDDLADSLQSRFRRGTVRYLALLVLAATSALVNAQHGQINVGLAAAALLLILAVAQRITLAGGFAWQKNTTSMQARWLAARGAAEAVRSAQWRFAMRLPPFDDDATAGDEWSQWVGRASARLAPHDSADEQLVARPCWMNQLRAGEREARVEAYRQGRIDDQVNYFAERISQYTRRGQILRAFVAMGELIIIIAALLQAFGVFSVDLVGVLAAALASVEALTQLRREESTAERFGETRESLLKLRPAIATNGETVLEEIEGLLVSEQRAWFENIRMSV